MKYSFNWLRELSGTKSTPEKIAELLTMHAFEIDSMEKVKNDWVMEIKVLPDRSHDCLSHVGIAREIATLENRKLDYDFDGLKTSSVKTRYAAYPRRASGTSLQIKIQDKSLCPRYIAATMKNIKVKESPLWLKSRLENCGINSINNVVDATNYVMLELGQPLHVFDANKLANDERQPEAGPPLAEVKSESERIIVRRARNKEKIELLDGVIKELTSDDLLITNGETPLALAGIKGGKVAEVTSQTKIIILEAANFNSTNIRKSRVRLGLRTEASDRFEKEIDPNLAEKAMVRVIEILEKIADGKLTEVADVYPKLIEPWKIKLDLGYVNTLLGENVPVKSSVRILESLGINVKILFTKNAFVECEIPTFRLDLKTQEDLIEEIGRVWGYEKIKPQPIVEKIVPAVRNKQVFFERKVKENLVGLGFDEIYNYSFYSQKEAVNCGLGEAGHLELENPQNPDQKYVRVSLILNIVRNIYGNLKNFKELKIFEVGRVYFPADGFPKEKRMLAMAQVLDNDKALDTFLILKGAVEDLLESFGADKDLVSISEFKSPKNFWHPARCAEIKIGGEVLGNIGEISPVVLENYKIKKRVVAAEIDLEILRKLTNEKEKIYQPIRKFPVVARDISMLAGPNFTVTEISERIKKSGEKLVIDVELFDIFKRNNEISLAFHLNFGLNERTLENKEVDKAMEKIISDLEKKLKVEVRK